MAEVELIDEIVEWLDALSEQEHDRVVVLIDRLERARAYAAADAAGNP